MAAAEMEADVDGDGDSAAEKSGGSNTSIDGTADRADLDSFCVEPLTIVQSYLALRTHSTFVCQEAKL